MTCKEIFPPLDSGGGADDWAIHWLIRTDGEVNKLHTQVIAAFFTGLQRRMEDDDDDERVCVCVCVGGQAVGMWKGCISIVSTFYL